MPQKCSHNKGKSRCKICGGNSLCNFDNCEKNTLYGKEGEKASRCASHKEIGMINMKHKKCKHNKRKSRCIKCNGTELCVHKKFKTKCKECGGGSICEHNIIRSNCKECGGGSICEHNIIRSRCKTCKGGSICKHNKRKDICKDCAGSAYCNHNRILYRCKECNGKGICEHNKVKCYCKMCGGSALCKSSWCETHPSNPKYKGYCLPCFVHLYPDEPNSRNYKTKERAVVEFVLTHFPSEKYSWIADKRVYDGCSKRRPDLFLDLGDMVLIIEVDENQHINYDCSCENKRLMEISQDIGHRPLVFIRFNPDDYKNEENKNVTSCWGIDGKGVCVIKKTKKKEWDLRLDALKTQIEYWINSENRTEKTVEVIQLFYDLVFEEEEEEEDENEDYLSE